MSEHNGNPRFADFEELLDVPLGDAAKLARIREYCNSVSVNTWQDAYDLACEIRDFIDGDLYSPPL